MVTNQPSETFSQAIFPPKERGLVFFWTPENSRYLFISLYLLVTWEALSVQEDFTLHSTCPCLHLPLLTSMQECTGVVATMSSWVIAKPISLPFLQSLLSCPAVPVSGFSLLHTFNHSRQPAVFVCLQVHLMGPLSCPTWTGHPLGATNGFRAPYFLDLRLSYFYFIPSF